MFSLFCPFSASIDLFPIALAGEIPWIAFNERSLTKFNSQHLTASATGHSTSSAILFKITYIASQDQPGFTPLL